MMRWPVALGCWWLALALSACAPAPTNGSASSGDLTADDRLAPDSGAASGQPNPNARWPFWPQHMRIHPLTRVTTDPDTDQPVIEARLEFQDEDGDATKAVGQARFDVFDVGPDDQQRFVEQWNESLSDVATNRLRFDDITRTYLFRLDLRGTPMPDRALLRAYFLSADGQAFRDSTVLRVQR